MKHWLIVWGSSSHAVRTGDGEKPQAAKQAFGQYSPEEMTFKQATLQQLQSDRQRLRLVVELLEEHRARYAPRVIWDKSIEFCPKCGRDIDRLDGDEKNLWCSGYPEFCDFHHDPDAEHVVRNAEKVLGEVRHILSRR